MWALLITALPERLLFRLIFQVNAGDKLTIDLPADSGQFVRLQTAGEEFPPEILQSSPLVL